jgi:hypothetical protein
VSPEAIRRERKMARTSSLEARLRRNFGDCELAPKRARLWTEAGREVVSPGYMSGPVAAADQSGIARLAKDA